MGRIGAFLIHLGISLVIFAVLAALVVYVWYPDYFFASDGGWQGIRIIVFVDLVLGPCLTLIVFNRKKPIKELRRDLSIVGCIQFACLFMGVYVVYTERPLSLVYVDGRFFSMSVDDYEDSSAALETLASLPGDFPKRVMVDIPSDPFEQSTLRSSAWQAGTPLRTLLDRYEPFDVEALNTTESLSDDLLREREKATGDLSQWIGRHGGNLEDYLFFPFATRYEYRVLGISKKTGEILGLLPTPLPLEESFSATIGKSGSTGREMVPERGIEPRTY